MSGANVNLVESLTVSHPLETERDAENYNAVLGQMSMRMDEGIALSARQAAKNIIPPKFILEVTIRQMQSFSHLFGVPAVGIRDGSWRPARQFGKSNPRPPGSESRKARRLRFCT